MSNYRTLNRTVLAKIESSSGSDSSPAVASDAVLVEDPQVDDGLEILNTNEVTGSLDPRAGIVGGGPGLWNAKVYLHGSGTGGTAPRGLSALLQACAMALTTTGSDVDDTAQAGGASTITLHSGASSTNDAYKGMVIVTNGGTGSGQTRVIIGYVGSTKVATVTPAWSTQPDNTTDFIVYANNLYVPASDSLKTATVYDYLHRSVSGNHRLRKRFGWAGNAAFTFAVRQLPFVQFTGQGSFETPTDVSDPGAATYESARPVPFMNADFVLAGTATAINTLTLDLGNQVQAADDPAATYGIDVAGVTRRGITGRVNPPVDLLSARDVVTAFLAGTEASLWLRWGSTAGNRGSLLIPRLVYLGSKDEDINGFAHEGIPFATVGEDTGCYLSFY